MTRGEALLRAFVVFGCCLALYLVCMQTEPYGDGISYLTWLRASNFLAHHLFYLPPLWVFVRGAELFGIDERSGAFLYSAVCAALGSGILCYLLARSRRLAPRCTCPMRLALLAATTPALIFYATQVENHANHYLWVCVLLLALDTALAEASIGTPERDGIKKRYGRMVVAGLALVLAFASHSTSGLLWPALSALIWSASGPLLRRPNFGDILEQVCFFGPSILLLSTQSQILVWLSGDPNWGKNASGAFALSLLDLRSLSTWLDYLLHELLLPFWGFVWVVLALGLRRFSGQTREALLALVAFAPYLLFFGHWNVREFGAYYLPLLPVFAIGIGRLMPALRREEALVLVVLLLGQGVHGALRARAWVESDPRPPWTWADDAAAIAGQGGTVFCWDGMRALHVEYDHPSCRAYPFHNWTLTLSGPAQLDPDLWRKIGEQQLQDIVRTTHEGGGRVAIEAELLERIEADPELANVRPFVAKLRELGLEAKTHGICRAWVVRRDS